MTTKFQVVTYFNDGEGDFTTQIIKQTSNPEPDSFERVVFEGENLSLSKADELKSKLVNKYQDQNTVYAVFFNRPSGEGFISKESDYSGNWKGSKHDPFSLMDYFKTEQEAKDSLKQWLERFEKVS